MQPSQFSNLTIHRVLIAAWCFMAGLYLVLELNACFALTGAFADANALTKQEEFRISDGFAVLFLIPFISALVGAWRGKPWAARWMALGAVGLYVCMDVAVLHPVQMMFENLTGALEGALLAALWLAPAGKRQTVISVAEVDSVKQLQQVHATISN